MSLTTQDRSTGIDGYRGSGRPWVFEQLTTGSGTPRRIELVGYAAPFGRPRQRAVMTEDFGLRHTETRYAGYSGAPTRHFFGTQWNPAPMELSGRWSDRDLGIGGVERLLFEWELFIRDQRQCLISWSQVVSFTGFVERMVIGRESATEVTWKLYFLLDEKDLADSKQAVELPHTVAPTMQELDTLSTKGLGTVNRRLPSLDAVTGELVDQVDDLVSDMNQASALTVRLGNSINNLFEASFGELERLRAGAKQFKTAAVKLSDTIDSIGDDALLFDRQADDDLTWLLYKVSADLQRRRTFASIADMEDLIDLVQQGTPAQNYVAKGGDTWESISTHFFGGPDGADAIRQANGIRYATLPVPGNTYQIPASGRS